LILIDADTSHEERVENSVVREHRDNRQAKKDTDSEDILQAKSFYVVLALERGISNVNKIEQYPKSKNPLFPRMEISFKSIVIIEIWREQNRTNNIQKDRVQYDEKIE
jgi:hypothetical protein